MFLYEKKEKEKKKKKSFRNNENKSKETFIHATKATIQKHQKKTNQIKSKIFYTHRKTYPPNTKIVNITTPIVVVNKTALSFEGIVKANANAIAPLNPENHIKNFFFVFFIIVRKFIMKDRKKLSLPAF